jgi:uncharacterized protein YndB with AHSA1/START domain
LLERSTTNGLFNEDNMLRIFIVLLLTLTAAAQTPAGVPAGKQLTGRSIDLAVVVDAPPDYVYRLWTEPELVNQWFAAESVIEARAGGPYEIYFTKHAEAKGQRVGSAGAKGLIFEPGKRLAFEWTMPPLAEELNTDPLPTWVEIEFEPVANDRTLVKFRHLGFQRGGKWDQCYEYFVRAWGSIVLPRLDKHVTAKASGAK